VPAITRAGATKAWGHVAAWTTGAGTSIAGTTGGVSAVVCASRAAAAWPLASVARTVASPATCVWPVRLWTWQL
jgi:hypothetical protein